MEEKDEIIVAHSKGKDYIIPWWWRKAIHHGKNYFIKEAYHRIISISPDTMKEILWRIAPQVNTYNAKKENLFDFVDNFASSIGYTALGENKVARFAEHLQPSPYSNISTSSQREALIELSENVASRYREIVENHMKSVNINKCELMQLIDDKDPSQLILTMVPALQSATMAVQDSKLLKIAKHEFNNILNTQREM